VIDSNDSNQRYKIVKPLYKNDRHIIYKAEDTSTNNIVSLKVLAPKSINDSDLIQSLYSESLNTASLSHPNIVEVSDAGKMGDSQFIAMEYLSGYSFMDLIKKDTKFSVKQILFVMIKTLKALEYFHKKGVIHRDIKPHHLMLTAKKEIKLIDFGLSILKGLGNNGDENIICGTSLYMSPEQIQGYELDHLTDIYSFGATMFHIVTLKPPFEGENIYYQHLYEPVPSIKDYRDDIPNYIQDTIAKCMDKDKSRRFSNAGEILDFLKRNS